eukprot:g2861.t1
MVVSAGAAALPPTPSLGPMSSPLSSAPPISAAHAPAPAPEPVPEPVPAARRDASGTPVTATPVPRAISQSRADSARQHLGRLLRLGWSGASHPSDNLLAPRNSPLGGLGSPLPQTPGWWEYPHADGSPDGVPLGGSESDEDEDTTPLYRRFGLTQSSDNSSVLSLSMTSSSAGAGTPSVEAEEEHQEQEETHDVNSVSGETFDFVQALLRHAATTSKRRRVYLDEPAPDADAPSTGRPRGPAKQRRLWMRCDARRPILASHISLMNSHVAESGHRLLTVLGCDASVHTRAQVLSATRRDPRAGGHWAAYFPICELHHVWSNLVTNVYFWGDRFAVSASVGLATSLPAVKRAERRAGARAGFDTMLGLVQSGDISEDELLCCAIVPCSHNATLGEIRRAGVSLMASLPGELKDGPVHFRRGGGGEGQAARRDPAVTESDHVSESVFRMCRETVADYHRMSELGTECGEKRKRAGVENRKDFVMYELSGIVWKVCGDDAGALAFSDGGKEGVEAEEEEQRQPIRVKEM